MQYSRIGWDEDFVWETVMVSSLDYPVDCLLFNQLPAEMRGLICEYLSWTEEMAVFDMFPGLLHPWVELNKLYKKQFNWTV